MKRDLPLVFALLLAGAVALEKGGKAFASAFGNSGGGSTASAGAATAAGGTANTITPADLSTAPKAVQAMYRQATGLEGRPYVWGGGHSISDWLNAAGYDCSGFVSSVLGYAGILSGPQTTHTLPAAKGISSGPGSWVTIYDRTDGVSANADHVIMDIGGHWFESGGSTNASGGVASIMTPTASYLSTFNRVLHPTGY